MACTPLDTSAREIRLLHFTDDKRFESGTPLSCRIKKVKLSQLGSIVYSAISYCWGDSDVREDILVDGSCMSIPATAEQALRRLHLRAFSSKNWREETDVDETILADYIWIDSVCINQRDLAERSSQVEIMSEIYFEAGQVLVWLGEDEFDSTAEFDRSIDILFEQCRSQVDNFRQVPEPYEVGLSATSRPSGRKYFMDSNDLRISQDISWQSIRLFFGATWFTRLWVVQEVLLAKRAHFCKGFYARNFMSVGITCLFLKVLDYARTAHPALPGIDLTSSITEIRNKNCATHSDDCVPGRNCGRVNVQYVLGAFSMRQSTAEPRDIVYAVIGHIEKQVAQKLMPVDYTIPLLSLFERVTLAAMHHWGSFFMLSSARKDEWDSDDDRDLRWFKDTGWPTWVPLYHERTTRSHQTRFPFNFYSASGRLRAKFVDEQLCSFSTDLGCYGQLFGRVKSTTVVFPRQPREWDSDEIGRCVSPCWELLASSTRYADSDSRATALCLTLLAGIGRDGGLMDENEIVNTEFLAIVQRLYQSSSFWPSLRIRHEVTHSLYEWVPDDWFMAYGEKVGPRGIPSNTVADHMKSHDDDVDAASLLNHHTSSASSARASNADCDSIASFASTNGVVDMDASELNDWAESPRNSARRAMEDSHETAPSLSRTLDQDTIDWASADPHEVKRRPDLLAHPLSNTGTSFNDDSNTNDTIVSTDEDDKLIAKRMQEAYYKPWELERYMATFAEGRKFFETDSGYIGIGPADTTVGDQVVILYGHNVPLILRACDDEASSYYIGACYVQDVMQGEYISQLEQTGELQKRERVFRLR